MATRDEVVCVARKLLGTTFHHQGRVPGVGLDCAGVPIVTGWILALWPREFDVTGYARQPDGSTLKALCDLHMKPVSEAKPGDVILVAWQDGAPQHLGILTETEPRMRMVHAESVRHNKVVESPIKFGRSMRFVAAYSFPGIQ